MLPADLPARLGRYALQHVIGVGGMGRVVAAHDATLQRDVAIKMIEPGHLAADGGTHIRFLFHREARATAALHHPNIIEIYDYSGPDAEWMYLACELIDGPTLAQRLQQEKRLRPAATAALGFELAQALEHAHGRAIVHRDLKPDNVFWTDSGRIVLADFGIAKAFEGQALARTIAVSGTRLFGSPRYMAPELLDGVPASPASDRYALGCVLYECLAGSPVFAAEQLSDLLNAVRTGVHAPLQDAPRDLADVIEALLRREPNTRPSGKALIRSLRRILDGAGVGDPRLALRRTNETTTLQPQPAPATASQWAERWPWWLAGALLLATTVVLIGKWSPRPSSSVPTRFTVNEPIEVLLDDRSLGTLDHDVRLELPTGRHLLQVRRGEETSQRAIYIVPDTEPVFDLRRP